MKSRVTLNLTALAGLLAALAVSHTASAQSASEVIGTWRPVSVINTRPDGSTSLPFGPNPKGMLMFHQNGSFAFILNRPDLAKFAANNRFAGTAEENKAIVQGSFAYFGTYSLENKVVRMHVQGGTWPGWAGTEIERLIILFSGDEMKWTDPTPTIGGSVENAWARIK